MRCRRQSPRMPSWKGSLRDLKTPWIRKLVFLGIAIAFLSQTTGVNSIMYFAPSVLIATGLDTQAALVATISNGVVSVVATVLGIYLLHRGVGRRPIIITGQAGLTAALAIIGLLFLLPESAPRSYLVLAGMGLAISFVWIANTIVSLVFPILINTIQGTTFFLFAVINVGTLIFYIRSIPETKDRSLETVEEELKASLHRPDSAYPAVTSRDQEAAAVRSLGRGRTAVGAAAWKAARVAALVVLVQRGCDQPRPGDSSAKDQTRCPYNVAGGRVAFYTVDGLINCSGGKS